MNYLPKNDAVTANEKIFPTFAAKLSGNDLPAYENAVTKLCQWLSSDKAYYNAARPKIIELIGIAYLTLCRVSEKQLVHVSQCPSHAGPWANAYVRLVNAILPFARIFVESDLQQALLNAYSTIKPPSLGLQQATVNPIPSTAAAGTRLNSYSPSTPRNSSSEPLPATSAQLEYLFGPLSQGVSDMLQHTGLTISQQRDTTSQTNVNLQTASQKMSYEPLSSAHPLATTQTGTPVPSNSREHLQTPSVLPALSPMPSTSAAHHAPSPKPTPTDASVASPSISTPGAGFAPKKKAKKKPVNPSALEKFFALDLEYYKGKQKQKEGAGTSVNASPGSSLATTPAVIKKEPDVDIDQEDLDQVTQDALNIVWTGRGSEKEGEKKALPKVRLIVREPSDRDSAKSEAVRVKDEQVEVRLDSGIPATESIRNDLSPSSAHNESEGPQPQNTELPPAPVDDRPSAATAIGSTAVKVSPTSPIYPNIQVYPGLAEKDNDAVSPLSANILTTENLRKETSESGTAPEIAIQDPIATDQRQETAESPPMGALMPPSRDRTADADRMVVDNADAISVPVEGGTTSQCYEAGTVDVTGDTEPERGIAENGSEATRADKRPLTSSAPNTIPASLEGPITNLVAATEGSNLSICERLGLVGEADRSVQAEAQTATSATLPSNSTATRAGMEVTGEAPSDESVRVTQEESTGIFRGASAQIGDSSVDPGSPALIVGPSQSKILVPEALSNTSSMDISDEDNSGTTSRSPALIVGPSQFEISAPEARSNTSSMEISDEDNSGTTFDASPPTQTPTDVNDVMLSDTGVTDGEVPIAAKRSRSRSQNPLEQERPTKRRIFQGGDDTEAESGLAAAKPPRDRTGFDPIDDAAGSAYSSVHVSTPPSLPFLSASGEALDELVGPEYVPWFAAGVNGHLKEAGNQREVDVVREQKTTGRQVQDQLKDRVEDTVRSDGSPSTVSSTVTVPNNLQYEPLNEGMMDVNVEEGQLAEDNIAKTPGASPMPTTTLDPPAPNTPSAYSLEEGQILSSKVPTPSLTAPILGAAIRPPQIIRLDKLQGGTNGTMSNAESEEIQLGVYIKESRPSVELDAATAVTSEMEVETEENEGTSSVLSLQLLPAEREADGGFFAKAIAFEYGLESPGTIEMSFEIEEGPALQMSIWCERKAYGHSKEQRGAITNGDRGDEMCLSFGCYKVADIDRVRTSDPSMDHTEMLSRVKPTWPEELAWAKLIERGANRVEELYISPPFHTTPDGLVDLSDLVPRGTYNLQIIQAGNLSLFAFVLLIHQPSPAQLKEEKDIRDKGGKWQNAVKQLTAPLHDYIRDWTGKMRLISV